MAALATEALSATGLNPTYSAAAAGGDTVTWSQGTFVHVKNGDTASHTVTVASQVTAVPGLAPADITVAIPAGESRLIGPFDQAKFKDSSGDVNISYDAVTSVTVAVLK